MGGTKNDAAWQRILDEVGIVMEDAIERHGFYDVDGGIIKQFREPRLACKIDFRQQIPRPLKERELSVLAVKNGRYRIARTDPFIDIAPELLAGHGKQAESYALPPHIQAISPQSISSESKALDAALVSRMLDEVFEDRVSPVLRNREFCLPFDFSLPDRRRQSRSVRYQVDGVQLEVDGGYEGERGIYLVEAKVIGDDSNCGNMNLRQLLYPQAHYQMRYEPKPVKTYVMLYVAPKRCFHFLPFKSADSRYMFDEHGYRRCALEQEAVRHCWEDLRNIRVACARTDCTVPFPQADRFGTVLTLFQKLGAAGPLMKEELFAEYSIAPRQYDYYVNVLLWMRLAFKMRGSDRSACYGLTNLGQSLYGKPDHQRLFEMAQIIFSNDACHPFLFSAEPEISMPIKARNRLHADTTYERRIRTVKSWRKYFQELFA